MSDLKKNLKCRNWTFTLYNYDSGYIEFIKTITSDPGLHKIKVFGCQEEQCPTTGKQHLQGYIGMINACSMSHIKKTLQRSDIHLEVMRGSINDSINYCSKSSSKVEGGYSVYIGDSNQGERTDLKKIADKIKNREMTIEDVMDENPQLFCQYKNGLKEIANKAYRIKRTTKTKVIVIYGASGSGKSRDAFNRDDVYRLTKGNGNAVWFDGYNYNKTVVIDDFYGWLPFDTLLQLTDRYDYNVDVKGSKMTFNSPTIVITSNKSPLEWYSNLSEEHKYALLRRIDECYYYTKDTKYNVMEGIKKKMELIDASRNIQPKDELMELCQIEGSGKMSAGTEVKSAGTEVKMAGTEVENPGTEVDFMTEETGGQTFNDYNGAIINESMDKSVDKNPDTKVVKGNTTALTTGKTDVSPPFVELLLADCVTENPDTEVSSNENPGTEVRINEQAGTKVENPGTEVESPYCEYKTVTYNESTFECISKWSWPLKHKGEYTEEEWNSYTEELNELNENEEGSYWFKNKCKVEPIIKTEMVDGLTINYLAEWDSDIDDWA